MKEMKFFGEQFFSKIWISIFGIKMKLSTIKKYAKDSVIKFPTKSLLRSIVFTETIRQRWGEI